MSLKDTLASVPPRETAGSRSADRFDYQRDWALCRLLTLHEAGQPYLMVFDYHDDVLVLDSDEDPTAIAFFQVKTKGDGAWTVSDLVYSSKGKAAGKGMSHVAKLYSNKIAFPAHTNRLTFVSNTYVNCKLSTGSSSSDQTEILFHELIESERNRLSAAIRKQCGLTEEPDLTGLLVFHAAPIHLKDHVGHAKGKVTEFLERKIPGKKIRPGAVYAGLAGEIVRRNHCTENCASLSEIVQKKGLSRTVVDFLLTAMNVYEPEVAVWPQIENRLNAELYPFPRLTELRIRWPIIFAKHTDPTNTLLRKAFGDISEMMRTLPEVQRLTDHLESIVTGAPKGASWRTIFDEDDIRIIALILLYDDTQPATPQLPTPNPGAEDATA